MNSQLNTQWFVVHNGRTRHCNYEYRMANRYDQVMNRIEKARVEMLTRDGMEAVVLTTGMICNSCDILSTLVPLATRVGLYSSSQLELFVDRSSIYRNGEYLWCSSV